ncbi:6-phosphofructo-2-kinase/fructose-2,6-bisphosphatase-like [Oscarella lobularis]|uniref:6-phosphofructo-2-kinase/fructose-2, 6-bisphosphatase-like n=1 Tax=Oscarella lobularis TaxID=121494 RepID=UPI0033139B82
MTSKGEIEEKSSATTLDDADPALESNVVRADSIPPDDTICQRPLMRVNNPLVIVMVGLPARGKTFMGLKLARYLRWIGYATKAFNVGEYRRRNAGIQKPASFFDPNNETAMSQRRQAALDALRDMNDWLKGEGDIGVFDATNTTRERRDVVFNFLASRGIRVLFVETICNDEKIIESNIREVKVNSPDYKELSMEYALQDFKQRIEFYKAAYEPLCSDFDSRRSYIQVFNVGQRFIVNNIKGHCQSRIVYYLMNLHVRPRRIFLTRHGESMLNASGKIGGNSDLSPNGIKYANALGDFIASRKDELPGLKVWTSQLKRTIQTAENAGLEFERWKALDELDAGLCDARTYEEIQEKHPEEFARRDQDKYNYRYPMGESYKDVVQRLEPVIMELERQNNVLVICHQAVMRCLLAYFLDKPYHELPYLKCPLHTVIQLTPQAYGCKEEHYSFGIDAADTHRPKPEIVDLARSTSEALSTLPQAD